MAKEKIIIVDDEEDILELLRYQLEREGYGVVSAENGERGLEKIRKQLPDLVVLDLMMPGIDGLTVCRLLKQDSKTNHIPIVMLTAKGDESDIVTGLELGADDYIIKPFSANVLLARLKAVLRRRQLREEGDVLQRGELTINIGRREACYQGRLIDGLTFTEFEILQRLARRPGWVFTRNQIVNQVKGDDYPVTERAIDVQIVGLRKKLGDAGHYIETVRGVGYRFMDAT